MPHSASALRRVAIPVHIAAPATRPIDAKVRSLSGNTMGTSWTVKFVSDTIASDLLRNAIEVALDLVVNQMSNWLSSSDLNRFHRSPVGDIFPVSPELETVIACGLRISEESDGAYDFTIGRSVDLWGFGPTGPVTVPPNSGAIVRVHRTAGTRHLELSEGCLTRGTDLQIDLSGIAKGFAVDLVAGTLDDHGIMNALVEIGGELAGRGVKPDGSPWWVSFDTASSADRIVVGLHDLAIATSGSERAFRSGGRSYSHTINPRDGRPIDNAMISATVVHRTCMEADAYATALMVLGQDQAIGFADRYDLAAVVRFIDPYSHEEREQMSSAFRAMLD